MMRVQILQQRGFENLGPSGNNEFVALFWRNYTPGITRRGSKTLK